MNEQLPQFTHHIVDCLQLVEGIVAIALGGSRARGNHTPKSDVDLGLYYQSEVHPLQECSFFPSPN
jgi:predicted nucleotidyltransferase